MPEELKILIVASEAVPFAKTGGLADVTGALPKALAHLGVDVRLILPKYPSKGNFDLTGVNRRIKVPISDRLEPVRVFSGAANGVKAYFIESDKYYDRPELYGDTKGDYKDNAERFTLFSRAVLEALPHLHHWRPDIIHCNDWQSALVPLFLKTVYQDNPFYSSIATLFTIHNLAYQGVFGADNFHLLTGLSKKEIFNINGLEFYGKLNFIKGGLLYADTLSTVSKKYAEEIQTEEYGCGLEGVLISRRDELYGVLNGIDYTDWDPAEDEFISRKFKVGDFEDKEEDKKALLAEVNLPYKKTAPLIGIVSRLAAQKGFDLLAEVIDELMQEDLRIVLLGTGTEADHKLFTEISERHKGKIAVLFKYDNATAHKIYAGSDMFLMPSRYEPCGLGQMISLKYGTIPVVRATGGLADTICEFDHRGRRGNGFVFEDPSGAELLSTIKRALAAYRDKRIWKAMVKRAQSADFSWDRSAKEYLKLYKYAIAKRKRKK
ncbi:MAG: glycogen synthase GlgA [bacterium]|nr:glycogen synthase GlgA [bacterium]